MSKETTSGVSTDSSGSDKDEQVQTASSGADETAVPKAHLEKVLKEKRNQASRIAELEGLLAQHQDAELKNKEQFKELADKRLQQVTELQGKLDAVNKQIERGKKVAAVKKHLTGLGLNAKYEDLVLNKLVTVDDLTIDPETGHVLDAEMRAKDVFQQLAGTAFFGKPSPGVDQSAPNSRSSISHQGLDKMDTKQLNELLAKELEASGV